MSEGMEPAAGSSGGGRNWRKADYPDKLMELQTLISQSAAGGNLTGMFYGAEMLVAILGIAWDFEDEEIGTIENQRTQKVITEFRDHRREIEKDWNGKVIHVSHDFTEKENVRHLEDLDE